jgi:hypothetical protein
MNRWDAGSVLVSIGLGLVALGVLAWLGALSWFARLPGDIRVERPGFRLYAPLVSMLIVSLAISLLMTLIRRFLP